MIPITDLDFYNNEMDKGTKDKLWFLEVLPETPALIVDYGCATGAQLAEIGRLLPDVELVGMDVDSDMLARATARSNMQPVLVNPQHIDYYPQSHPAVLVLSSVIHEVYSYCTLDQIHHFWEWVRGSGFDYICIRDMALTKADALSNVDQDEAALVEEKADPAQLEDYQSHWGNINLNTQNFIHYLFKYRYTQNWTREVVENYFPVYYGMVQDLLSSNYSVVVDRHEIFAYNQSVIQKDFGVTIAVPTHYKVLLKVKANEQRFGTIA